MQAVLTNEAELHARVFQFPTSAIKLNGRKINYYDFITRAENDERVFPKIDMEKIAAFIDGTPVISDLQKQFYSRYLQARYDLILSPAYKLIEPQK